MPSPFTSSFASAAAGNSNDSALPNNRNGGSGDWSRARTNGNTTTFRRPSGANNLSQRTETAGNPLSHTNTGSVYVPPHANTNYNAFNRNGGAVDTRYSKDQLLDLFSAQQDKFSHESIDELFVDGWNPKGLNGAHGGGWGRSDDRKDIQGPEICWEQEGNIQPLGLTPLTNEEEELFNSSVNSPIKPPAPNKDGTPNTPGIHRRTSLSHGQGNVGSNPRTTSRQRRDSSDMLNNTLTSPTSSRFSKDESSVTSPPPSLLRRKTDFKDNIGAKFDDHDREDGKSGIDTASPMASLRRTATNPLSAGLNGPSSPWSAGPASAGFAPMGAFGNFGAPQSATDRKPGFGRSESRFKSLMSGTSSEDMKKKEGNSFRNTSEVLEEHVKSPWDSEPQGRRDRSDLHENQNQRPAGSAALGGEDASPPPLHSPRLRNTDSQSYDDIGFSSIGGGADLGFPDFASRNRNFSHHQAAFQSQQQAQYGEPLSPTYTNPYQSPEAEKAVPSEFEADDLDALSHTANASLGRSFQRQLEHPGERSQTSSAGATRGFPSLTGLSSLGSLSGVPRSAAPGAVGTPSKAFADSPFSGFGDIGPPNSGGFGGSGFFGATGSSGGAIPAGAGRGSKLASFLPGGIPEQSRGDAKRQDYGQDDGAPLNSRSRLDDILSGSKDDRQRQPTSVYTNQEVSQPQATPALQAPFSANSKPNSYFSGSQEQDGPSSQLPHSQQRQMVMPDRMRWIYRDPQGNQQGPWSGLEMHDWYKAGFFSPELQIKKMEDSDYEPLAQLIRRIGNSREPFLVPQIGIPHGQPSGQPNQPASASVGSSSAQPPFASSFPSFGTTLTAEQQNALERRKQEEQYLMARQKEHLVAMQPAMRMQSNLHNQQLHHHSSAHSLHSQPSYGSITSPNAYQAPAGTGPIQPPIAGPGFYDGMLRHGGANTSESLPGHVREEELPGFMERMNLGRNNQAAFGGAPNSQDQYHQQQVNAIMQEKARMQLEQQQQYDNVQRNADETRASTERLEEFQRLRTQEAEQQRISQQDFGAGVHTMEPAHQLSRDQRVNDERMQDQLSLSEQVQKTKNEAVLPQPFPPAQSSSPMPAPTPQRNRQSVADALNAESQSQSPSQTDHSADTPSASMAPWAKEATEASKGPSLKEIQAIEARKAAQQEEVAAAARRAAAEQERLAQQNQPTVAPAPGLPSSSNWASSVSPAVPAASPWSKPVSGKPAVATPATATKKTLAQIQKEEEARKNRAAAAAAATASTVSPAPGLGGKRYADLAGKSAAPAQPSHNAAWTTVGAGGKVKTPAVPTQPSTSRTVSGGIASVTSKPKISTSAAPKASSNQQAHDEFQKWIRNALGKGLNAGIPVDDFVSSLLFLPLEADIISDSIYASSATLDGRRFAEEFVKRRKLADRGVVSDPATGSYSTGSGESKGTSAGGWSEVAKKGSTGASTKEADSGREFRVVAGKKKGKR